MSLESDLFFSSSSPFSPLKPLKVLVLQMTSTDSVCKNVQQIQSQLAKVPFLSSFDLVSLPENSLYFHTSKEQMPRSLTLDDKAFVPLQKYCDKHNFQMHVGSVPLKTQGGVVNATVWLSPQSSPRCVYKKIHLFDVGVKENGGVCFFRESDQFVCGTSASTMTIQGWSMGLSICYDLRFSELYHEYAKMGVLAILVPSAFTEFTGRDHWHCLLRARAIESQCFVIAAAQSGQHPGSRGVKTFGHSLVYGPWGEGLGEIRDEGPGTLSLELDPCLVQKVRQQIPMSQHRRL